MMHRLFARVLIALASSLCCVPAYAQVSMRVEATGQQGDGKILVAGEDPSAQARTLVVGRLNADGTMDGSFGSGGWTAYAPWSNPALLQVTGVASMDDGGVLVSALHDGLVALFRFTSGGSLDTAFGSLGGFHVDNTLTGVRINAMAAGSGGSILGFGNANNGNTGNVTRAAIVRYFANGIRDESFPMQLPVTGESDFRAAERIWTGSLAVAGYVKPGSWKTMLMALVNNEGQLDTSQSFNNHTGISTYATNGFNLEAFGIGVDNSTGDVAVVGRDGHTAAGQPMSYMTAVWFSSGYYNTGRVERVPFTVDPVQYTGGDSTGMSLRKVPGTANDWLMAGTVINPLDGHAFLGFAHFGGPYPYIGYTRLGPRDGDDRLLAAAYPSAASFVAVGTHEPATGGQYAMRLRFFRDYGDFDTDFSQPSPDTTPNPMAFATSSYEGAGPHDTFTGSVRVTGIDTPATISVTNAQYALSNDPYYCDYSGATSSPSTVLNGQYVCFVVAASSLPATTVTGILDVGGVQATLAVTTGSVPETTFTSTPPATSGTSVTFAWSVTPFAYSSTSECSLDGAAFAPCSGNLSNLPEGSHTFRVRGVNDWGPDPTPATYTWNVLLPPDTTIVSGPAPRTNATSATFTFSANHAGATFQCSLDGSAYATCPSGQTYSGLSQNTHNFSVRAVDAGGTDASPAQWTWVTDYTPPTVQLFGSGTGGVTLTTSTTATFSFSVTDAGGVSVQCQLDGGAFASCTSPFTQGGLADGQHTFTVRGVDTAGNTASSSHSWTIDTTPPETTITASPPATSSSASATFSFSSESFATFECRLDAGAWATCSSPFTLSNLASGNHAFEVRAKDVAGNVDASPALATWTVDTTAPDATITSGPPPYYASTSATFAFGTSDATATLECKLDNALGTPFTACTSPVTLTGIAQSGHTFYVRARDPAGNVTATPASWTWYVDTVEPQTTISTNSMPYTSTATVAFYGSDDPVTFQCSLDGVAFSACTSPLSLSGLADGQHTLQVRAIDGAGNVDSTPASKTWTVDTTPPETTFTATPYAITQSSNAQFGVAANESGVAFNCRQDGGAWFGCGSDVALVNLGEGTHTFEARATDAAGNTDATPATFTWTVNYSYGPETAITSAPSGTVASSSATITFNSPSGTPAVAFQCGFDGASFACSSPWTANGLADGPHSFNVYAIDAQGNIDRTPASAYWTVDTSAPDTTISGGPSGTVTQASATFTFTATDPAATFECRLDGAAYAACTSPKSYSGLADGMHVFDVRAKDAAGNIDASPASATWSIDATAPNTTISSGPAAASQSSSATFAFSSTEPGTFQCKLDAGPYGPCTSPVTYAALGEGTHSFSVYSIDAAGNSDASAATWSWTIDLIPDTSITASPATITNSTSASFTFTSTEAGTFECKLDAGPWGACTSPKAYTGLGQGSHTFQVRARDSSGNYDPSPASFTWTIDTSAPNTTITGGPSGNNNPNTATFTFTSSEAGTFECKLDTGAWGACTSPKSYSGLAVGSHTFSVRSIDGAGNVDGSPATRSWSVK